VPAVQRRGDFLVVGRASGGAVAGAAGGHALGLVIGDEGAPGVTGLGAHVGAGQVLDRALGVAHRLATGLDGSAVPAGGGTGAADRRADRGLGGAVDHLAATVVGVDQVGDGPVGGGCDEGGVVAGEDGLFERPRAGAVRALGGGADGTAVARSHESVVACTVGGREPDGAATTAHVEGVATDDVGVQLWCFVGFFDLYRGGVHVRVLEEVLGLGGVGRLADDRVALHVGVPAHDAVGRTGPVEVFDDLGQAFRAVGDHGRFCAGVLDRGGGFGVGEQNGEFVGVGVEQG